MAERRIVVPVVGGSSPLIHPSSGSRGGRSTGKAVTRERVNSCAPLLNRPALRAGHRNSLARLRRAAASSDGSLFSCERGSAPFHTFPPISRAANGVRCHSLFCSVRLAPFARLGRRRERRCSHRHRGRRGREPRTADREKARGRLGAPTSGRHRGPEVRGRCIAIRLVAPAVAVNEAGGRGALPAAGRYAPPDGASGPRPETHVRVLPSRRRVPPAAQPSRGRSL